MRFAVRGSWLSSGLAALMLAVVGTSAWAQGIVQGRVTAQGTNAPLPEARVIVIGTSLFTTTNAEGAFTLRNVPSGNADVRVIRVGYQEQKKSVTVASGRTSPLDFVLQPTVVQLEQV